MHSPFHSPGAAPALLLSPNISTRHRRRYLCGNPILLRFIGVFIFCGAMLAHAPGHAADFSSATFFGDSLTDTGFLTGVGLQPSYTTNPDPVWASVLSRRYGLPAPMPANGLTPGGVVPLGGNNYAVSGARVSNQNNFPSPTTAPFILTVTQQFDLYLSTGPKLDKRGLYGIWAGANDVSGYLKSNAAALSNPATQAATLGLVIGQVRGEAINLGVQLQRLQQAGAGTILTFNLPDLGRTPSALATPGLAPAMSQAARAFNAQFNDAVGRLGGNVAMLDTFRLFNEVFANPGVYGFQNVTDPACTTPDASTCTSATLATPGANRTYLFADDEHPTGAAHAMLAAYAFSVLQAPGQIGMLAEAPLSTTQGVTRAVDGQLRAIAPRPGEVVPYASYEHSMQKMERERENTGMDRAADNLNLGVSYGVDSDLMAGANLGLTHSKTDFSAGTGGFRLDQISLAAYLQYQLGAWKLHGLGLLGKLNYGDVRRRVALGPAVRDEHGDTAGEQYLLRMGTRYDISVDGVVLSPLANLTWQQVNVDAYSEKNVDSTSMRFQAQRRRSTTASIGMETTGKLAWGDRTVSPFLKLTRDLQLGNREREVRANVIGMAGSFGLPVRNALPNRTRLDAGVHIQSGKSMNLQFGYSASLAGGDADSAVQAAFGFVF